MFKHNWAWIKSATDNFSTALTRNLQNPRDYAPLMVKIPFVYCQLNMEDLSVTGCINTFVTECVFFKQQW